MQPFKTQFNLSRDYLSECFDQSLPYGKNAKPNFLFPVLMLAAGGGLLFFTEHSNILGGTLTALGMLEMIHIRYRRAWWLARQMWGGNANSKVELTIDENGIKTQNASSHSTLKWADIERVIETDAGLILVAKSGGQQYLSKSIFSAEIISQIISGHWNQDN